MVFVLCVYVAVGNCPEAARRDEPDLPKKVACARTRRSGFRLVSVGGGAKQHLYMYLTVCCTCVHQPATDNLLTPPSVHAAAVSFRVSRLSANESNPSRTIPARRESEGSGLARRRRPHPPRHTPGRATTLPRPRPSGGERRKDGDRYAQVHGRVTDRARVSLLRGTDGARSAKE